jgi:hypothetical protein
VVALDPIIEAIRTHVMSAERIHADDTTAKLKAVLGRIWTYFATALIDIDEQIAWFALETVKAPSIVPSA